MDSHREGEALPRPRAVLIPFRALSRLGHGVNDIYFFALPLVLPLILKDFDISFKIAGLILASFLGVIALFSFLFGRMSDRFSPWIVLGGGFILASAGFLTGGMLKSLPLLILFLSIAAVGVSTYHPVIYALIDSITLERRGRVLGIFEFWGAFALTGMYFLSGLLLRRLGWHGVLILTGIPGLALGGLFLFQGKRYGGRELLSPPPRKEVAAGGMAADGSEAHAGVLPLLVLFLASCMFRFLSLAAVVNFLPTYLAIGRSLPASLAAYATAFIFLGGLITSQFWGRAADRFAPLPILLIASALPAPLIFLLSLPLPVWANPPLLLLLGAVISGSGPAQNLLLSLLGSRFGRGTVFGVMLGLLGLIGSISPALFGLTADHLGLRAAMRLFSLPVLFGWLTLIAFSQMPRVKRLTAGS